MTITDRTARLEAELQSLVAQAENGSEEARRRLDEWFQANGEMKVRGLNGEVMWVRVGQVGSTRHS
jgi:hypothetical protein